MNIEDLKVGDKIIYKHYLWGDMKSFRILTVNKILKTKIKTNELIEFSKEEIKNYIVLYNEENLKIVKEEYKQNIKKYEKPSLLRTIFKSKFRLQVIKEIVEEIEKEMESDNES